MKFSPFSKCLQVFPFSKTTLTNLGFNSFEKIGYGNLFRVSGFAVMSSIKKQAAGNSTTLDVKLFFFVGLIDFDRIMSAFCRVKVLFN